MMAVVEMHKNKAQGMMMTQLSGKQLQCLNLFIKSVQDANKSELLSAQEKELIDCFRQSDEQAQRTMLQLAKVHAG